MRCSVGQSQPPAPARSSGCGQNSRHFYSNAYIKFLAKGGLQQIVEPAGASRRSRSLERKPIAMERVMPGAETAPIPDAAGGRA
jgi:hypothetical protein